MADPTGQIFIEIKGGVAISVPASPRFLTTYVLLEQEDWFEKEIGFVRRLLRPGMRALDIGANYGVYTASIAAAIGPTGRVWAFEPASGTAAALRRTIARNGAANTTLLQLALSDRTGTARLNVHDNSELNSLSITWSGAGKEVALSTIDNEAESAGWGAIDFVKLDAEGEEARILQGGRSFFATQSPLVMFELKHGESLNLPLLESFKAYGYSLYRLIGPDTALVPFAAGEEIDSYELNLFAAKPDRAAELEAAGLLTQSMPSAPASAPGSGTTYWAAQPFAAAVPPHPTVTDPVYGAALDNYAVWRGSGRPLTERYAALSRAVVDARSAADARATPARLSSLARIAFEAGRRAEAVTASARLLEALRQQPPTFDEPGWPTLARYEQLSPGANPADWLAAAAAEAVVRWQAFSGYFLAAPHMLELLNWLASTRFSSTEIERRRWLLFWRDGRQPTGPLPAQLQQRSADHLNPELWRAG
ncbi:MAG TPA: FkbM family methyltransferase [Stellaceae bacterium]|jgi:FkbM family methyltransferase|nr:FkbM family methyltransferase [Stellaceae bacterium]